LTGDRRARAGACLVALALVGACRGGDATTAACLTDPVATDSGLRLEDLSCGRGTSAARGDTVTVDYVGSLRDGTVVDSSRGRREPFTFPLGAGQVIAGWEEGVPGMREGGVRRLVVPAELAFGASGVLDTVPAGATLVFEIELLEVAPVA
jgi:FKBP-type peptidyl-prolyl cis-trans isomerase FkpA